MTSDLPTVGKVRVVCDEHPQQPHVVTFRRPRDHDDAGLWALQPSSQAARSKATVRRFYGEGPNARPLDPWPSDLDRTAVKAADVRFVVEAPCRQCRRAGRWRLERLSPILSALADNGVGLISLARLNLSYARRI